MGQRLLNVRVRPARVAVLINRDAPEADLLLAFEFFSKIWGGRFGQLLAVDARSSDPLTRFRLGNSRPDFVYGIGLDDEHWSKAAHEACQPRTYYPLRPDFFESIDFGLEKHRPVDDALIQLFRDRDPRASRQRLLQVVTPTDSSALRAYCAAVFGIHYPRLREDYRDEDTWFTSDSAAEFVKLAAEFVRLWRYSWLDVGGYKLSINIWESGLLEPTIVLVSSLVPDLALFWNLRTASETTRPAWAIPFLCTRRPTPLS
jgi:hypothetical protein